MEHDELDALFLPTARRLQENHMAALGIEDTQRLAYAYNRAKFGRQDDWRRALYKEEFGKLLEENGGLSRRIRMNDGWAIDATMSLPHLGKVLEQSEEIIVERAGHRLSAPGAYRSYFQDLWTPEDLVRFPAFLDFATSSDLLAVVADYIGCVPALSTSLPSGVRFVESNAAYDDQPNNPRDSQLFHVDYYSLPNVYVLVLLRDTTIEHGPWTFLPRSVSDRAGKALGNWKRRRGYRFTDAEIYSVVDRKEVIEFSYPKGTVLFIESSGCFHYGSRNSIKPRFQLMLGYTGACRTDFTEILMKPKIYPKREGDSRLRKMVLDKNMLQ